MKYVECLVINDQTRKVEVMELTETMAENLSEIATVVTANFLGGKATIWRDRVPSVAEVDRAVILELKRRAIWREAHAGLMS